MQVSHFVVKAIDCFYMRTPVHSVSIGYNIRGLELPFLTEKDDISQV